MKRHIVLTTVLIFSATAIFAQDQTYEWVDKDGIVHYSDQIPRQDEPATARTKSKKSEPRRTERFEQVSYFKGKTFRGYTIYVANPSMEGVDSFCDKMKERYRSVGQILKIYFFDNKLQTPNVTSEYYFPESSDDYLVAEYFFNPFNGKSGLKYHKPIR